MAVVDICLLMYLKGEDRMKVKTKRNISGFIFALPWIIGFVCFSAYPIVTSMYYSFTEFNMFQAPNFVGIANYKQLFQEAKFWKSLYNTLYMTVLGTPLNLAFGLFMANLLNKKLKGMSVYRTIFYMPTIVPAVASTLLWIWILNPTQGLLNNALKSLGLPAPNWLGDPQMTKPALLLMGLWGTGGIMLIFLAALQDVPKSLYEAAEIDGANSVRRFFSITLPSISPVIFFQLIMSVISNFQYFTQAYLMTNANSTGGFNAASGGPENSLLFYALYLYQNAFAFFKMGKASAMAWILFIIVAIVTYALFKTQRKWVTYGE